VFSQVKGLVPRVPRETVNTSCPNWLVPNQVCCHAEVKRHPTIPSRGDSTAVTQVLSPFFACAHARSTQGEGKSTECAVRHTNTTLSLPKNLAYVSSCPIEDSWRMSKGFRV